MKTFINSLKIIFQYFINDIVTNNYGSYSPTPKKLPSAGIATSDVFRLLDYVVVEVE